jgi:hypothetical protein
VSVGDDRRNKIPCRSRRRRDTGVFGNAKTFSFVWRHVFPELNTPPPRKRGEVPLPRGATPRCIPSTRASHGDSRQLSGHQRCREQREPARAVGRRHPGLLLRLRGVPVGLLPVRLLSVPVRLERQGRGDGGFPPRAVQGARADHRGAQPVGFRGFRRTFLGSRGPASFHREPALIRVVRNRRTGRR